MLTEGTVLGRILAHAGTAPGGEAVWQDGSTWSMADLAAGIRTAGAVLSGAGVTAGTRVAVRGAPSFERLCAWLGCWQVGATYVPLDHRAPAGAGPALAEQLGCALIVDTDLGSVSATGTAAGPAAGTAPAYLMQTSGTTGRARAAAVGHALLASYAETLARAIGLAPGDRYLVTAPLAFSSSIRQVIVPLVHGCPVVLAAPQRCASWAGLSEQLSRSGATVWDVVPPVLRTALGQAPRREPGWCRLRLVVTASDALRPGDLDLLARAFGAEVRHANMYGLTETGGIVAAEGPARPAARPVSCGRPLHGRHIVVLDPVTGAPAGPGEAGEVHVRADIEAGYPGDPRSTAAAFRPDPAGAGHRLLATGDLGFADGAGALHLHGRTDEVVKIGGQRVHPLEVEHVVAQHPGVGDCAVRTSVTADGGRLDCVYTASAPDVAPTPRSLRAFVTARLPAFKCPATFGLVESIERSRNGKVRRLAGSPAQAAPPQSRGGTAPSPVPVPVLVRQAWRDALDADGAAADDFFEQGGGSLAAIRMLAEVSGALGIDLDAGTFFENPTLGRLVQLCHEALGVPAAGGPAPTEEVTPVSEADGRQYEVVVNEEEQYSVWPAGRTIPDGWTPAGVKGTKDECLDHIERVWVDITPKSLRQPAAG